MTIREQLAKVRDLECVSITELALLTGISERTLWRRLAAGLFPVVIRSGRVTKVQRLAALRALKHDAQSPKSLFSTLSHKGVKPVSSATQCQTMTA